MRILRHKHNRKTLHFFKIVYGFVPPYRVLLDGNFIAQAVKMAQDVNVTVPRLLQDKSFLHVTECVLRELSALGPDFTHALAQARTISVIRCKHKYGHKDDMDAHACLKSVVGTHNEGKFIVATQDGSLRDVVRGAAGVPIMMYSQNVLVLEPPSKASKSSSASKETAKSLLTPEEARAVRVAKRESKEVSIVSGETSSAPASARSKAGSSSSGSGAHAGVKRKRHGPSEPNPLSIKRKTPVSASGAPTAGAGVRTPASASSKPRAVTAEGGSDDSEGDIAKKSTRRSGKHSKAKRMRVDVEGSGSDEE